MNQIDYSDINKFLTSIGLIIIGVAFLIPWYINQNLDMLLVEQATFEKTTEAAKTIIIKQQTYLLIISNYLPLILIALISIGIGLITFGICRWDKRQLVINGIQDEDWKAKKSQNISIEEKREQIENTEELQVIPKDEIKNAVNNYIAIEESVYLKIAKYYSINYLATPNIRIGQFEYDIILKSKFIHKRVDLIIEIKYFKKNVSRERLLEVTRKFIMAITYYEQTQQRHGVIPILLLIFDSELTMEGAESFELPMKELAQGFGITKLRIIRRLENNIASLSADKLINE